MRKVIKNKIDQSTIKSNQKKYNSYFDETVKAYLLLQIKFMAICIFSLGLAYPWALCMKYRAKYHHTVICGRRLKFIGCPKDLAHHWIFWWLLCIVTLGLFSLVLHVRMEKWITSNTIYDDMTTDDMTTDSIN